MKKAWILVFLVAAGMVTKSLVATDPVLEDTEPPTAPTDLTVRLIKEINVAWEFTGEETNIFFIVSRSEDLKTWEPVINLPYTNRCYQYLSLKDQEFVKIESGWSD